MPRHTKLSSFLNNCRHKRYHNGGTQETFDEEMPPEEEINSPECYSIQQPDSHSEIDTNPVEESILHENGSSFQAKSFYGAATPYIPRWAADISQGDDSISYNDEIQSNDCDSPSDYESESVNYEQQNDESLV